MGAKSTLNVLLVVAEAKVNVGKKNSANFEKFKARPLSGK
jgi:hypothetical protein